MKRFIILLVEDDSAALDQMTKLLRRALNVEIHPARSVDEAMARITEACSKEAPYPLAILDFKLPKIDVGGADEVDESVCAYITTHDPETIVGHITGFPEDPRIQAHIERVHKSWRPGGFFLNKRDPEFGTKLVAKTREALYGSLIEREISELFPLSGEPRPSGARGRVVSPRLAGSVSNRIADLCLNIGHCWNDLNPEIQNRVKQFLVVNEDAGNVSVFMR